MRKKLFRGIRPDDPHGRMGLRNPERGFRTEIYFSTIPGETAGTCSCHSKQNKLDGRSLKPSCQNETLTGCPRLIRGNRLDAVEFSHAQWQDELDYFAYDGVTYSTRGGLRGGCESVCAIVRGGCVNLLKNK